MKESIKTLSFTGVALVLAFSAARFEPESHTAAILEDQGETFFPQYKDPQAVKTIEVIAYDEATASAKPLKVAFEKGRWILPSHYNYPLDMGDRLTKTAGVLIDLKRGTVVTESVSEYGRYGVIDPLDSKSASFTGRGKHVTLRGAAKEVLADFILGKPVEGKAGFRYARVPSEKRVYAIKTDADPSANFADWVDSGLLRVPTSTIRRVQILNYSIDEQFGRIMNLDNLVLTHEDGKWKLTGHDSFKQGPVDAMAATLNNLKIVEVRPKPESMAAGLKSGQLAMTLEMAMSMRQRGFFLGPTGRLLANEGELIVETANGLSYALRFGEVATQGESKPAAGSGENRFLFVTATYNAERASKYGDSSGAGERLAKHLNEKFADWYYVIRGSDFQKLHLKSSDLGVAPRAAPVPSGQ